MGSRVSREKVGFGGGFEGIGRKSFPQNWGSSGFKKTGSVAALSSKAQGTYLRCFENLKNSLLGNAFIILAPTKAYNGTHKLTHYHPVETELCISHGHSLLQTL